MCPLNRGRVTFAHYERKQAITLFRSGKVTEAEVLFKRHLNPKYPDLSYYYGRLLLENGNLDAAERQTDQTIQTLYQTKQAVAGMNWEHALGSAHYQKGLIRVARSLPYAKDYQEDWALNKIQEVLSSSRESFEAAHQLIPEQTEWKTAIDFLDGLGRFDTKQRLSAGSFPAYVSFVRHISAFNQLELPQEIKPEASATPPTSQTDVRSAIQMWQNLKRQAFLSQNTDSLEEALTGPALEETISAVNWWSENSEVYHALELKELRFLEISYSDPEQAKAKVSIHEIRDNSREGRTEDKYFAHYQLERIGTGWYIYNIKVEH